MFPLKERVLIRGCQEHINAGLGCGADYVASYTELYAPFSGRGEWSWGTQGGWWYKLYRDNGDRIEMAHNSELRKEGDVMVGELIAITGNTGSVTTGPHLHIQIFDSNNNRLDPETYNWEGESMGFSEEHIKTLTDHTLRKASSIFFATRPEADVQADIDSAFGEVKNGSTDSIANVIQNYSTATNSQLIKKTDCTKLVNKARQDGVNSVNCPSVEGLIDPADCPDINSFTAGELIAKGLRKWLGLPN